MHDGLHTVVFSGGGTGGHLYPALALADALRELRPDIRTVFLGAERGIEARILPELGREHILVPVRGVARGVGVVRNLGVPWALLRSLLRARAWFRAQRPELVVVTGGYAGMPAGMMAGIMGIPLALQEQNALPGVTTRFLSRRASQIHVAYPEAVDRLPGAARPAVRVNGNPVRVPAPRGRERARTDLGLDPDRTTVLVTGGSQGSLALNRAVLEMVRLLDAEPPAWQLLWVTGPKHEAATREALGERSRPWLHLRGYLNDMPAAMEGADLAVSRAGAMTTSELLAWGLPAILVPLPTAAEDHQAVNARALEAAGCAVHLPQSAADGARLLAELRRLLGDAEGLGAMSRRARERGQPEAAARIAEALSLLVPGGTPPETSTRGGA